jgi:hypothetical protein
VGFALVLGRVSATGHLAAFSAQSKIARFEFTKYHVGSASHSFSA